VPLVFALAGLLAATSASTARGTDLRSSGGRDLADSIRAEQRRVDEQLRRVTALRADIDRLTVDLGGTSATGAAGEVRRAAGFAPVTGPAITVSLDDAPRKPGTPLPEGVNPDDVIVHQQDVQGVVNALWAGGAEAMQLMDQRVVSTSAVRCVGNVLILQGRQYPPPYTVTAIGPVDRMREALERSPSVQVYREYVERVGLRYAQRTLDGVTLPGYTGASELQHARALTDTSTVTPRPTSTASSPPASAPPSASPARR
jgi:uncharacterized protein YlxW (UPF0749 family)